MPQARHVHSMDSRPAGSNMLSVAAWPRGTFVLVWTDAQGETCGHTRLVLD